MPRILIATSNNGKVAEFSSLLGGLYDLVSLRDVGLASPDETGVTFEENAILKATAAAQESGLITVADDSGLEVDALGGQPGVRSARFAGESATDSENVVLLLDRLNGVPEEARTARFVCVIAVAMPNGRTRTYRGVLPGTITTSPRGTNGFGYDPVLELSNGRTVAELLPDEKNAISHRGNAFRTAIPYLHSISAMHV